jgi:hypothetical protein
MNSKLTLIAGALAAAILAPGIASASFVLDTGVPTGSGAPVVLTTAQFLAGEFAVTAGEDITQLAAYLTQGVSNTGTFTFDIYSGLTGNTFLSRSSQREAPLASATGTFTGNGWSTASVNWVAPTTGDYWLALQVSSSTTGHTLGLDAPVETSSSTGTVPAAAFAYAPSSGQYQTSGAPQIGLEVTAASPVPLPASAWLLGSGLLAGLGAGARRRRGGASPRA